MSDKATAEVQTFGIGAVAKLTGLSDHTIRVWERRYGAVVAGRADNGRRRYTEADVEKLSLLKLLTDNGLSISLVANDDIDALRRRAESVCELSATAAPSRIQVAVLGDVLPGEIEGSNELGPLRLVAADSSRDRFRADIAQQDVDVLILEFPVVGSETLSEVRELMDLASAARALLVFKFAKSADIASVRDANISVLRSPVTVDEVKAAVVRAYTEGPRPRARRAAKRVPAASDVWDAGGAIEPRRFTQEQLAKLAGVSSTIECECPQHLAHLVGDLSAFEIYSERCANRNDEDAALHRHLHRTTARARTLIEEALERVARAEGIDY